MKNRYLNHASLSLKRKSPWGFLIKMALSVYFAETLIMLLFLVLPKLPDLVETFADSTMLSMMISPALYFFVYKPLVQEILERSHIEVELRRLTQQLQESFGALEEANKELEQRVAERTATLQEESHALQEEVEHLLDVISAVENGDLTAQAQVSPRITGLVGDTLNRLVERLGQVMANVLRAAFQVTQGTEHLERLAVAGAESVREQTQSVERVQTLIEKVNDQAQDAASQAVATGEAVQLTQVAIDQGQQEITTMTQGIQGLQRQSDQIVKRTETLTNYVELATQFVKDQQRITAMSQLLAVNASMLANRAKVQQNPEQMAAITYEFEVISGQVNQLATQTKQGLILLQQRTDQIQSVVSGLNYDVQEISQQVSHFTVGVEQSQQAFNTILALSGQVSQMGQKVTQSSQAIASAAQTTLQLVHYISDVSAETFNRAGVIREQAKQMEQLARTLLQNVEFFQLRPEQHSVSDLYQPPVLALAPALVDKNHHKK